MSQFLTKQANSIRKRWRWWRLRRACARIENSGLFDRAYYVAMNDDVGSTEIDPVRHFVEFGWREGRKPHPAFDAVYYRAANEEVALSGVDPLEHYVNAGRAAGLAPNLWCEGSIRPFENGRAGEHAVCLEPFLRSNTASADGRASRVLFVGSGDDEATAQRFDTLIDYYDSLPNVECFAILPRQQASMANLAVGLPVVLLSRLTTGAANVNWQIARLLSLFDDNPPTLAYLAGLSAATVAEALAAHGIPAIALADDESGDAPADLYTILARSSTRVVFPTRGAARRFRSKCELLDGQGVVLPAASAEQVAAGIPTRDPRAEEVPGANDQPAWVKHLSALAASLRDERSESARPRRAKIIFSSPDWSLSGVNTFTETLIRELVARDYDAYVLFTRDVFRDTQPEFLPEVPYRVLPCASPQAGSRWKQLVAYLNGQGPCVFVPNYDYFASAASGMLADHVGIVGIVHSDDVDHYEHVNRLGRYWNHIVAVSDHVHRTTLQINPGWAAKTTTIPYGIPVEENKTEYETGSNETGPLRLIYTGRLVHRQKNVLDFVPLAYKLRAAAVPFELTLVGDGECSPALESALAPLIDSGHVRLTGRLVASEVHRLLEAHDVFLLLSDFEGLPLSLLEALRHGCVPITNTIESGIPDVISPGINGYIVPKADSDAYVEHIAALHADRQRLARMKAAARDTLYQRRLTSGHMAEAYARVFDAVLGEIAHDRYRRPTVLQRSDHVGQLLLPPTMIFHPDDISVRRRRAA